MDQVGARIAQQWDEIISKWNAHISRLPPHFWSTKPIWEQQLRRWIEENIACHQRLGVPYKWDDDAFWNNVPIELFSTLLEFPDFDAKFEFLPSVAYGPNARKPSNRERKGSRLEKRRTSIPVTHHVVSTTGSQQTPEFVPCTLKLSDEVMITPDFVPNSQPSTNFGYDFVPDSQPST